MSESKANYGWESDFPFFSRSSPSTIRERLAAFVTNASPEQVRAWNESIPPLQREMDEVVYRDSLAAKYGAVLEYELPLESRRADVVLLVGGCVLVLELKGKSVPVQADLDQAAAYARDLTCYHAECADRPVVPVVVPMRARGLVGVFTGVHVVGPDALDGLVADLANPSVPPIDRDRFLSESAYRPLPSLVEAARELFEKGELRRIKRADAATRRAIDEVTRIVREAAATGTRKLVLITGVPGAGKTLVGLQVVHSRTVGSLATEQPSSGVANAIFLSGNNPLVQVLQYQLSAAGGGGRMFVRHVRDYVKRYGNNERLVPDENLVVFDEAQRAHDAERVAHVQDWSENSRNEPDLFVAFAERRADWSVILALIGSGQEIFTGDEGGLKQWRNALETSPRRHEWQVHIPVAIASEFKDSPVSVAVHEELSLDVALRQHVAENLHAFVADLLGSNPASLLAAQSAALEQSRFNLRLTRSLGVAKRYLRERFEGDAHATFGLVASSRDKTLVEHEVPNDYNSTKVLKVGPWFTHDDPLGRSCRSLETCVTEFQVQGLELDGVLLAWGTDFIRVDGKWSDLLAKRYKKGTTVYNPFQLRLNTYRVLLTRAREAVVVFVPRVPELDETFRFLRSSGFRELG